MPCNHPRHAHIWPRDSELEIKSCERICAFCPHVAQGSAELLKEHVYEAHILRNYLGVLVFPGLRILDFLDQPEVPANDPRGRIVASIEDSDYVPTRTRRTRRNARAPTRPRHGPFYRRIVITEGHGPEADEEDVDGVPQHGQHHVKEERVDEGKVAVKEEREMKVEEPADVKMEDDVEVKTEEDMDENTEAYLEVRTEGRATHSAKSETEVKVERFDSAGPRGR